MTASKYQQILQRLAQYGSYEQTAQPRDISKLAGIKKLLTDLEHPEQTYQIIHIAGTNGKGLTGAMLSYLLTQEGYRTGWYSSPHLEDIRERIVINQQWIDQQSFANHAQAVFEIVDSYQQNPYISYFDLLTAIAFCAFRTARVDWVVLETGLGGKADSTNVTDKALAVLTNIGYDHMRVLGNTLKEIAHEKLGILRPGVPVVLGAQKPELFPWLCAVIREMGCSCSVAKELRISIENAKQMLVEWQGQEAYRVPIPERLRSAPWQQCANTALRSMQILFSGTLDQQIIWIKGLQTVSLPGRLDDRRQVSWGNKSRPFSRVLFDGGHNQEAIQALVEYLSQCDYPDYTLILGLASDKLVPHLHVPLASLCRKAVQLILTQAQSPRAATPTQLRMFIADATATAEWPEIIECLHVREALAKAYEFPERAVVIAGSFYLLGEIFHELQE